LQKKLFGTDGVRGLVNINLTPETAYKIGKALAQIYDNKLEKIKVIVAKDTRASSDMLQTAICSGLLAQGANVEFAGVMPTGAVSFLAKKLKANAGVMITASHNDVKYNGIKIFNGNGFKLTISQEYQIERLVNEDKNLLVDYKNVGQLKFNKNATKLYQGYLLDNISGFFDNFNICLDCANGAGSSVAPKILKSLKANVVVMHSTSNGFNINKNCGATNLASLSKKVKSGKFDIGFALDGDADRLMTVDENGRVVDTDSLIFLLAKNFNKKNKLNNNALATTIMSNYGLEVSLKEYDILLHRTKIGDKYVIDHMLEYDLNFGAENSGHYIFKNFVTTSDAIFSMIKILQLLKQKNKPISELIKSVKKYPQVLLNLEVDEDKKLEVMKNAYLFKQIKKCKRKLKNKGRVIVRPSGTENLIRVMVEGLDEKLVKKIANHLKKVIEKI